MRSTRATAAVAGLNARSAGRHYKMIVTGNGLFTLRERIEGNDSDISGALSLDEFVQLVNSMGPQTIVRITKSEAAFAKQLVKKSSSS